MKQPTRTMNQQPNTQIIAPMMKENEATLPTRTGSHGGAAATDHKDSNKVRETLGSGHKTTDKNKAAKTRSKQCSNMARQQSNKRTELSADVGKQQSKAETTA